MLRFENSTRLILERNRQVDRHVVLYRECRSFYASNVSQSWLKQRGELHPRKNSVRRFLHGCLCIERSCVRTHGECMLMRLHDGVCTRWVHLLSAQWTVEDCLTPHIFTMCRASRFSHTGYAFLVPAIYLLERNKRHVNHVKPRRLFSIIASHKRTYTCVAKLININMKNLIISKINSGMYYVL